MFEGLYVALVTPFTDPIGGLGPKGVDETKLRELVQFYVKNGTSSP
jgi:dihydrodipicolinate synthase/N-acetylneuraminate lyase